MIKIGITLKKDNNNNKRSSNNHRVSTNIVYTKQILAFLFLPAVSPTKQLCASLPLAVSTSYQNSSPYVSAVSTSYQAASPWYKQLHPVSAVLTLYQPAPQRINLVHTSRNNQTSMDGRNKASGTSIYGRCCEE